MCAIVSHFLHTSIPEVLKMPTQQIYYWYKEAIKLNKKLNPE